MSAQQQEMIVDSQAPTGNVQVGNPATLPVSRDLAAERDAERARDQAAARQKEQDRFTVRKFTSVGKGPSSFAPEYESLILKSAANYTFQDLVYPTVSTYVPNFNTVFAIIGYMDMLMCNTRKWTENCSGWAPPISQMFFTVCLYYQVFVAMDSTGIANQDIILFIQLFERIFPLSEIWIPGPLVAAFRALSSFRPDANDLFAGVTPAFPASPGFTATANYIFNHDADLNHLLPNLSIFISRLRNICAVATTANMDEPTFAAHINSVNQVSTLFNMAAANNATFQAALTAPGAAFAYGGNLRLWQNASSMIAFNSIPLDLDQTAPTAVNDSWTSAMRFENNEHLWFAPVSALMSKYAQFWNGSVSLDKIRPTSSAAGSVKLRQVAPSDVFTVPTFVAATAAPDPVVAAHFRLRNNVRIVMDGQLALRDTPQAHIMSGITFNFNAYWSAASQGRQRAGTFWTLGPNVKSNTAIEVFPGLLQTIAREYHRDTRLDSHKQ